MVAGPTEYTGGEYPNNSIRAAKTFTPVGAKVCIQPYRVDQTKGGLQMPDGAKVTDVTPLGVVISVGPECKHVKEGDVAVCFSDTPPTVVIHGGQCRLCVIEEKYIAGVATDEYKDWRPRVISGLRVEE